MAFSTLTIVATPFLVFALVALVYGVYRVLMLLIDIFNALLNVIWLCYAVARCRIPGIANPITAATLAVYYKLFLFLPLMTAESARICAISSNALTGIFVLFHAALAIHSNVMLAAAMALGVHNAWWSWDQHNRSAVAVAFTLCSLFWRGQLEFLLCMTLFSLILFVIILAEKYSTVGLRA